MRNRRSAAGRARKEKVLLHFSNDEISQMTSANPQQTVVKSAVLDIAVSVCGRHTVNKLKDEVLVFTAHQLTEADDLKSVITMDRHRVVNVDLAEGAAAAGKAESGSAKSAADKCGLAWIKMDVTPTVQTWLFNADKNFGIFIECKGCWKHGFALDSDHTRLDIDSHIFHHSKNTLFQTARPSLSVNTNTNNDCSSVGSKRCCRQKMRVDLTEIDTFSFVVKPTSFDAHVCNGRCPPRFKPTNDHSLLQSLIHLKTKHMPKDQRIPRPCCTPTKLLPLDILHLDPEDPNKLKVTHWKNIIVAECGCS